MSILVIGGGFAGLSTAYHLALHGARDVVVIEREKRLGGHASGRNAGMIRQSVADPVTAHLAHEGREAMARAARRGWRIGFRPSGSLLLAKDAEGRRELNETAAALSREGVAARWFSPRQAASRVPVLRGADFKDALFCPSDAAVDIGLLLNGFLKALETRGIRVFCGCPLERVESHPGGFTVLADGRRFSAARIVNAAGAWAGVVGRKAGASAIPFKAYRRHLFFSRSFRPARGDWPFVWDVSRHFYFRPWPTPAGRQGKSLLLSPCDKDLFDFRPGTKKTAGETIDPAMRRLLLKKASGFSPRLASLQIAGGQAGLRTMAPDGRFVIGEDPKLRGFFWVAGLGGHGVTASFSCGRLAADLILGKKDPLAKFLSPARFLKKGNHAAEG